ncbi:hypothetical protein LBO01_03790 [Companilactobacillus paralimentarius]|nr:hypothetical protein LBO01_03790 [Companilactobacillus paralimentarius]
MAKFEIDKWVTSEGLIQLEGWARDGLTDEAYNIGIGTTLCIVGKIRNGRFGRP